MDVEGGVLHAGRIEAENFGRTARVEDIQITVRSKGGVARIVHHARGHEIGKSAGTGVVSRHPLSAGDVYMQRICG